MFDNVGYKLKVLATIWTWIGSIGSCIFGGLVLTESPLAGALIMILGSLLTWISSLFTYGFGQLIENSDQMVYFQIKDRQERRHKKPQNNSSATNE